MQERRCASSATTCARHFAGGSDSRSTRTREPAQCAGCEPAFFAAPDTTEIVGANSILALATSLAPAGLPDRRRNSICRGGESGVPPAHPAGVAECGAGEFHRRGVRIGALPDVVPGEHVLAELCIPMAPGGAQVRIPEA